MHCCQLPVTTRALTVTVHHATLAQFALLSWYKIHKLVKISWYMAMANSRLDVARFYIFYHKFRNGSKSQPFFYSLDGIFWLVLKKIELIANSYLNVELQLWIIVCRVIIVDHQKRKSIKLRYINSNNQVLNYRTTSLNGFINCILTLERSAW